MNIPDCPLCIDAGGELLVRHEHWRVILADEADYPGFVRVIWNEHVAEMTDLPVARRALLMDVVWTVEQCVREAMSPDKVNVATLGNVVPHLHWHVIPRWRDDASFPAPIWAPRQRECDSAVLASRQARAAALGAMVRQRLA